MSTASYNGQEGAEKVRFDYHKAGHEKKKPSLSIALWKTHGMYYALSGVYKLMHDLMNVLNPQILG